MTICSDRFLYHYVLGAEDPIASILERGLLPLSSMPDDPRWHQSEPLYRQLYAGFAQPILQRPFTNSGIFLTPLDFKLLPGSPLAARDRIAIPVDGLDWAESILTYEWEGERLVERCSQAGLSLAAERWTPELVQAWFGRNNAMLFFHVPQVALFTDAGLTVQPEWVERAVRR